MGYAPFPGVYVGFEPELKIEFELKMNIIGTLSYTSGISYESGKGIQDLSTSPKLEIDVDVEGTCFFGIDMKPNVGIIGGKILKLTLSFLAGVEITSEMTGAYYDGTVVAGGEDNKKEVHDCDACLKTDIEGKIEISAGLEFLNWSFLKVELEVTTFTFRIGTCYYSFDRGEFGWGTCPHIAYRVTINILDDTNAGVSGVEVLSSSGEVWGCTNKHGVIIKYLPSGEYTMSAEVAGQEKTKTFTVSDACYVSLALADHLNNIGIGGIVNSETITDNNSIIASGECGDSAIWELNGNGLLTIKGSGKMTSAPWKQYAEDIRRVSIEYGVTSIYGSAFGNCSNVVSVSLSDSITSIGSWAFSNCESLEEINIPNSVTTINEGAFWFCKKLKSITIPSGVTRIDNHVFLQCNGLVTVNLPASITYIEEDAFWKCTSLKNVTIGSKVTSIGAEAFYDCSSLESISIPASVTSIGLGAFDGCAALKYINVDENNLFYMATDGVLYDQTGAALICAPAVGNVTIPDSVTSIDACAFRGNTNLHSINIPDNILTVGDSAFGECANLNTIVFSGDVPEFGSIPFHNVTATIYYPANNTTWTSDVMQDYGGTITWVSYTPTETATASVEQTGTIMATYSSSIVQAMSVFGGEYETEVQEEYVLKTASFSSLVPGEDYILLAMVSIEAEDVLSSDNLLYIDQGTAGEDGTLVFQYVQRVNTDTSYVMACGASDKDLSDATITFPEMYADSDIQAVEPTVVYDGETLVESKDYVIVGTVDYTEAGEYTCYIRGIYDYTGLVACTYTVDPARLTLAGANMVLGSTLDMNFFINKTDLSGTDYFAEITHYAEDGTTTTTVSYDQWDERTNYMVVTLENLAARQMADKIEVVIYNGNGTQVSEMWTDSIRDYAMRILENQDAETKTMLVDMLNYGAAAQTYFEYNTADLANNQLTTEQQAYATETASCTDQRVKGDNYYGSTMVLKNRIMLTMYFQNITTDMYALVTFTDHKGVAHENCIEGSEFAKYNDTTYGVTVDDLVVADGDQLVTVTIYDGDSNVVAYASDTVNSYTGRMMSSDILFEQVAKFTTSAYAYFH